MPKPAKKTRHGDDLVSQIAADSTVSARRNERRKMAVRKADQEMAARAAEAGEDVVPARLSRKILDVARAQQAEVAAAQDAVAEAGRIAHSAGGAARAGAASGPAAFGAASAAVAGSSAASRALAGSSLAAGTRMAAPEDLDDDEEDYDEEDEDGVARGGDAEAAFAIGGDAGELTLDPAGEYVVHSGSREDVDLFNRLLAVQAPAGGGSSGAAAGQSISDLVGEKMREAERAAARARGGARSVGGASALAELGFSERVIKVFSDVAAVLSRYRAGKLPKVMKILPGMAGWEDLLGLTGPDAWTPHAFYAITRVFASNLNDVRAQRFFNLYLLPAVRNDIQTNHKLNYHLYQALRKALYKPAAWYKGILLPLAASGDCTLREATIVASVLTTRRVPPLQSAAAVYKLATMRYSPAISVFLRMLLSKKYALPFRVVDAVADHFAGFASLPGPLPVLWHQAFLAFATHYSASTTQEQRERLKHTIAAQVHRGITLEVRRELFSTPARDGQGGKLDARKADAGQAAPAHIPGAARTMVVSAGADEDLDMYLPMADGQEGLYEVLSAVFESVHMEGDELVVLTGGSSGLLARFSPGPPPALRLVLDGHTPDLRDRVAAPLAAATAAATSRLAEEGTDALCDALLCAAGEVDDALAEARAAASAAAEAPAGHAMAAAEAAGGGLVRSVVVAVDHMNDARRYTQALASLCAGEGLAVWFSVFP